MIEVKISGLAEIAEKINAVDLDAVCFDISKTLSSAIRRRVHTEGKASDGTKIGTYSKTYMKVRTGNYDNAKIKKGANAGTHRKKKTAGQAGVYTKGKNAGKARPVYNRGQNTDVILSLTRQMENDLGSTAPIRIDNGYGVGFSNEWNYKKAIWQDDGQRRRYGKAIWSLSDDEKTLAEQVLHNHLEALGLV